VKKGIGNVVEDFSRSEVFLFLETDRDRWAVQCAKTSLGLITAELPNNMAEGVYHVELIWYKGEDALRSIQRTKKECIFAIDKNVEHKGNKCVVRIESIASPYGYDGLNGYDLAIMRGEVEPGSITEKEWASLDKKIVSEVARLDAELAEERVVRAQSIRLTNTEVSKNAVKIGSLSSPIPPLVLEDGRLTLHYDEKSLIVRDGKLFAIGASGSTPSPSPGGGGTASPIYTQGRGITITTENQIKVNDDDYRRWNGKQDYLPYYSESSNGYAQWVVEGKDGASPLQSLSFKGIPFLLFEGKQINWGDICNYDNK
jgi:hypothetical protein